MPERDATHGDIMHRLGCLQGTVESIRQDISNNRTDVSNLFDRMNEVEKRIAQGVILCVALTIVMPIVVGMFKARVEFGPEAEPQSIQQPRTMAPRG